MMQRILSGEWPVCRLRYGWMNHSWAGVLCLEVRWEWCNSSAMLGQQIAPWVEPFDEMPF